MRVIAAATALGLAFAATAYAETYTDPSGRISFEEPAGWDTYAPHGQTNPDLRLLISGSPSQECHYYIINRANTANETARTMRRSARTPIGDAAWTDTAAGFTSVFNGPTTVANARVDETTSFWPIQRADFTNAGKTIYGAMQVRPGIEFWTFCLSVEGADNPTLYNQVINSVVTTRDAELRAQAEAQDAERAAAEAAAQQPAQAEPEEEERPRRRRN